jgi:cytochrome c556
MKAVLPVAAAFLALGSIAQAQDIRPEVKARQGQFQILALNVGILANMARGVSAYDAEAAQAAARSVVGVSMVNPAPLFAEGTDNMSIDGTRAQPNIWENLPDVVAKWQALGAAAATVQTAAAEGPQAIGAALGGLAGTCKACHDVYRAPN